MDDINKNLIDTYYQTTAKAQIVENTIENLSLQRTKGHNMWNYIKNQMKEGVTELDGVDLPSTLLKLSEAIASVDTRIDELKRLKKDVLSYVDVMPHVNKIENPNALTPDEIYALNTRGYKRDEPPKSDLSNTSPPPAKPSLDPRDLHLYRAGDPFNGVIADRLASSERHEDMIRKSALDSQEALNDKLDAALEKLGPDVVRKLNDRADEMQKINRAHNMDRNVAHYEAYFSRLGR